MKDWPEAPELVSGQLELIVQFCQNLVHVPASCWDVPRKISGFVVSKPGRSGNMPGSLGVAVTQIFCF